MRTRILLTGLLAILVAPAANAQTIRQAIEAYNEDRYVDAAYLFYDVAQNTEDPDDKVKAEYYLAHSLYRADYLLPAFQYYGEVFTQGEEHPYFLRATEGLLQVARDLEDDILVPELISQGYTTAFAQLQAEDLNGINYMVGLLENRKRNFAEAVAFLEAVTDKKSPYWIKARYLLAIIAVQTATDRAADDYSEAIDYFTQIQQTLESTESESLRKLRRLATLGKGRAYYSQGDFRSSIEAYENVPRFTDDWYDAMYESGWAYFQNADFGRALGMVHSVHAPYFDDRFRPESFVLKSTTYFQLCHFDRVRKTLEVFFEIYEPMNDQVKKLLEGDMGNSEYVNLVVDGAPQLPEQVRLRVLSNEKFKRYLDQLKKADRELERARTEFPDGNFKGQLTALLEDLREQWTGLVGRLARELIVRQQSALEDFLSQARIIQFETADAERKMLEAGKDITKGPRAKGPRPFVPNATYQFWGFQGEYWIDELGYYSHSIKDECIPEVFE
ncbi:MAG: hypothetical protein HC923_09910 [Myxococcales bacterium]|nr:hypothetical protein [Myxococcales bacterium]